MHCEILEAMCLRPEQSIKDAIRCIDASGGEIALVVDDSRRLVGSVTDGDVRRALLRGTDLDAPASKIMNVKPRSVRKGTPRVEVSALMQMAGITQVPIVDGNGVLVDIVFERDFARLPQPGHQVVIMAGGMGSRLRPITENLPKPMIELGGRPILETIIKRFESQGFDKIVLCVNYRADMIIDHFGDGAKFGVSISYVHEDKRLGTAGALSLLAERTEKPIIVTNGDVLTTMDYVRLLDFHDAHNAHATMCLNIFKYQLPYGAVEVDGYRIVRITEKPVQQFLVNAGVYVINPEALDLIPSDTFFDMPSLFDKVSAEFRAAFPLHEYWLDIGQLPDLERAKNDFSSVFGDDSIVGAVKTEGQAE
jgi:choline kinase/predicted transcriptional regulator